MHSKTSGYQPHIPESDEFPIDEFFHSKCKQISKSNDRTCIEWGQPLSEDNNVVQYRTTAFSPYPTSNKKNFN